MGDLGKSLFPLAQIGQGPGPGRQQCRPRHRPQAFVEQGAAAISFIQNSPATAFQASFTIANRLAAHRSRHRHDSQAEHQCGAVDQGHAPLCQENKVPVRALWEPASIGRLTTTAVRCNSARLTQTIEFIRPQAKFNTCDMMPHWQGHARRFWIAGPSPAMTTVFCNAWT